MAEEKSPAAAPQQKKKEGIVRKPSALKRDIQSEKRRQRNCMLSSQVMTAIRNFKTSIEKKDSPEVVQTKLNTIYKLMDQSVKKGVFKPNKASRIKSRMAARV